jgi:hypothetical protein
VERRKSLLTFDLPTDKEEKQWIKESKVTSPTPTWTAELLSKSQKREHVTQIRRHTGWNWGQWEQEWPGPGSTPRSCNMEGPGLSAFQLLSSTSTHPDKPPLGHRSHRQAQTREVTITAA